MEELADKPRSRAPLRATRERVALATVVAFPGTRAEVGCGHDRLGWSGPGAILLAGDGPAAHAGPAYTMAMRKAGPMRKAGIPEAPHRTGILGLAGVTDADRPT